MSLNLFTHTQFCLLMFSFKFYMSFFDGLVTALKLSKSAYSDFLSCLKCFNLTITQWTHTRVNQFNFYIIS